MGNWDEGAARCEFWWERYSCEPGLLLLLLLLLILFLVLIFIILLIILMASYALSPEGRV